MNDAELYHKHNSLQKRDAMESLEEYAKKIKWKNCRGRVLDIGCGDGDVTITGLKKLLPMVVKKLVGCDINEEMVQFASTMYSDEASFIVLDISKKIPVSLHNSFDHVFSSYVLHWIKQQETAITNIYNLLDEGGDCLLIFLGHIQMFDIYRVLSKNNKWSSRLKDVDKFISPYHDSNEPEKEVKRLMAQKGFKHIEVRNKKKTFTYDSIESLKKAVAAVNPFDIPEDLMEDYLENYLDALRSMGILEKTNDGEPVTISFEYGLIVAYGRK